MVNANAIAGLLRDGQGRLSVKLKQRSETLLVSEAHASRFRAIQDDDRALFNLLNARSRR